MLNSKLNSHAFITPGKTNNSFVSFDKQSLYNEEKRILKESFKDLVGNHIDWTDSSVQQKLKGFAKQIIETTTDEVNQGDIVSLLLPTEIIEPGDTMHLHEVSGVNINYGTYGAAVRMSKPQFSDYSATTKLQEVGLKLGLIQLQTGKYSASELGTYTANLIKAWRTRLLFTTTLSGMTEYASGGDQYVIGNAIPLATMLTALDTLTDESEPRLIVSRRKGIAKLSSQTGYSNDTRREWEQKGQVGTWGGVPLMKVNSFTDSDYGLVYPMEKTDMWIFSEMPAGRAVIAGNLRTADETILSNETYNIYFRWDDGFGIWHTDRIVRIASV